MSPTRNSIHIRTSRNIRGFRVCRHSTGISMAHVGDAAIVWANKALVSRQQRVCNLIGNDGGGSRLRVFMRSFVETRDEIERKNLSDKGLQPLVRSG